MLLVGDRLRPAGSGRVLRPDPARHRQRMRTARVWIIEDDANIAAVGIAAREAHSGTERIGERHSERKQQRPRTIIAEDAVAVLELQPEQHLGHVVAARAELVEDLLRGNELLFLDPIHFAAGEDQPCDLAPVHVDGYLARIAISHGQASIASITAAINRSIWSSPMPTTLKRPDCRPCRSHGPREASAPAPSRAGASRTCRTACR